LLSSFGDALGESVALLLGFSTEGERERFVAGLGDVELFLDDEGDAELFLAVGDTDCLLATGLLAPGDLRFPAFEDST